MSIKIYYVSYTSTLSIPASLRSATLFNIYQSSKTNNTATNIQGFTLFKQGKFFQYMEGDELSIANLYRIIELDPRHKNIQLITQGTYEKNRLNHWNMYCFNTIGLKTGDNISDLLTDFDTYHWQPQEIEQLVQNFSTHYIRDYRSPHGYEVKIESYAMMMVKQFFIQHLAFITLQVIFLLIALILVLAYKLTNR